MTTRTGHRPRLLTAAALLIGALLVAVGAASAAVAGPAAPAAHTGPAAPASPATVTASLAGTLFLHTTTGLPATFGITGAWSSTSGAPLALTLGLSQSAHGGTQAHSWSLTVAHAAFRLTSTGAVLDTAARLGRFGAVDLVFTRTSQQTTSCSGGTTTTEHGELHGTARLDTGTVWGDAGSASSPLRFTAASLTHSTCAQSIEGACLAPVTWSGFDHGSAGAAGYLTASGRGQVSYQRSVTLTGHPGAVRTDTDSALTSPPTWNETASRLTIPVGAHGVVSGGGLTVTASGSPIDAEYACLQGSHQEVYDLDIYRGTIAAQSAHPVTFHFAFGGSVTERGHATGAEVDLLQ